MSLFYKRSAGLAICTLFSASALYAQQTITGTVKDANGPISGVTVAVKGTTRATQTTVNGSFNIQAAQGETIRITRVGYTPQEILVGTNTKISITLSENASALDEVVVTGLGESRERRQLGYAMTQISGEDIAKTNAINPIAALQGMVPGMQVNVGTGGPQSTPRFLIRGASSLDPFGNTPLIVVDGIIMDDDVVIPNRGGEQDFGNILKNFNLDDIESISVLNGGSVTALYGSRASNGVILITTKKGYSQRGLGVSFTHTQGIDDPYATVDFQDKYGTGILPNYVYPKGNDGLEQIPATYFGYSFGPAFDGRTLKDPAGHEIKFQPNNNILDLYQTGQYRNSNLALSGGNEQTTFRISYSNSYAKGVVPQNKFDRNSIALRATHRIRKAVVIDAGATYVGSNSFNPNRSSGGNNLMYGLTWGMPREYDLMYWKDQYLNPINGGVSDQDPTSSQGVFFTLYEQKQLQKEENFRGNINAKINFTDWLQMENIFSVNLFNANNEQRNRGQESNFNGGSYRTNQYRVIQTRYHSNINYRKTFNDFEVTALGGAEVNRSERKGLEAWTNGMRIPDIFRLSNSTNAIGYTESKPYISQSFSLLFQGAVTYKKWLTLNLYGRNDWDSSLLYPDQTGTYSYFYPGMDLAWTFHEALKLPSTIFSFSKLRFSYNIVGKGTDAYRAMTGYYLPTSNYISAENGEITRYYFDSNNLGNRHLVPEKSSTWETGTDLRFLNNRLGIDFTYYQKNTKNQIINLPVSQESGVSNALINSGHIRNQGIEAKIYGTPIKKENFSWDVAFNYTRNRSKIIALAPGVTVSSLEGDDGIRAIAEVGGEYGVMVASYGLARFQARDGSGNPIDHPSNGKYVMSPTTTGASYVRSQNYAQGLDKEIKIGSTQPKFLGSIINTVNYKALSLSVMLDSKFGGYVYSPTYNYGSQTGQIASTLYGRKGEAGGIQFKDANGNEAWGLIPDGVFAQGTMLGGKDVGGMSYQEAVDQGLKNPMLTYAYYNNTYGWGAGIREKSAFESSWVMVRDVSVSYDLPRTTASRFKLNNLRMTLSGRNLGYLYNSLPDNINPEDYRTTGSASAFLGGGTPLIRSFSVTLNTNF
ncbi:SusC/RagA family TonB-linked outer membrane protein [uncultured Sphingobacterium sp.]|jgi:iron complex outermembrane receptor protein|uniref:SusC/RagA family TonB-linked outer membrane protein n=2 Tax=Bacteria TaxID=2 RepID=UPI00374A02D1